MNIHALIGKPDKGKDSAGSSADLDVLQIDITGNSTYTCFKRWWYNQFLLSKDDFRCKQYYLSSFSVAKERLTHFRKYRKIIHPFSKFRYFWDFFIMFCYVSKKPLFHYNSTLVATDMPLAVYVCAQILEVMCIIDIFINMSTGYIYRYTKTIILEPKRIFLKYLSTQLLIDALGAFPLHAFMFIRYGSTIDCSLCKSNYFASVLRCLDLFNLIKVIQVTKFLDRERNSYKLMALCKFFRIFGLYCIVMMTILNIFDSLSLMTFISREKIDTKLKTMCFHTVMLRAKYAQQKDVSFVLVVRVLNALLLFGYKLESIESITNYDKLRPFITFVVANAFYIWFLIESYSWLSRLYYSDDKRSIIRDRTINMLRSRQLPEQLCQKVKNYFMYSGSIHFVIERNNSLYLSLVDSLKREIFVHKYERLVRRIPLFAEWPDQILYEIIYALQEEIYMKGDVVSIPRSQGDGLVIVEAGELSVFNMNGKETSHLIDGDYFGELSLVTDKEMRMSTVVAVSDSKVLLLDTDLFRRIMRKHPEVFFELKKEIKERFWRDAQGRDLV